MAVTEQSYTGNGSTTNYSFTFPYLKSTDIEVQVDATVQSTSTWSLANATTVQFNTAPSNGAKIKILRQTNVDSLTATFYPGSAIKSEDLNDNYTQNLYKTQEVGNRYFENTGGTMTGDLTLAEDVSLTFEGATDDAHETTLTVADPTADRTITLPNVTGTVVTTGDTATVTATMLAANSVDSSELVDGSIDTSHIADSQVTTAKIAADAVTGAKIADDQINSEHYVDGSIDTAHIADNQITSAKIANETILTANIASGQITQSRLANHNIINTDQLQNNSVATAKIIDDAVTNAKMADDSVGAAELIDTSVGTAALASNAVTLAKMADNAVGTSELVDSAVTTAKLGADAVTGDKIADNAIGAEHLAANSVTTSEIADAELTTLAGMQTGTASILAGGTALTATLAEINTVVDGKSVETTISDTDAAYPTSGAVVDYVAAQIAPIGGLEVIATEVAFPNTQPASGVVISIADAGGVVVNGSGTSTTGRTVGGSTVTINNINSQFNSTTLAAGVGLLVSSTGSGQIYNYHKATLKESDLANLSTDINDFNNRYRVNAGEPGSNNDEGDLVYDTNADKMKVYDSSTSAWKEVTSTGDFKYLFLCPTGGSGAPTLNGSIATYDLRESSNSGSSASITSAAQLLVSINGVVQKANTGTSAPSEGFALVDANTIIFGANLASGDSVFIVQFGSALTITTPGDNTVATAKLQNLAVTEGKIANDAVTADKLANSINTEIAANTAKVTNATHSGEVTGATALTIADDVVDEANLKVSNAPTNGYVLTAQSGNTGGMTWEAASAGATGGNSNANGVFWENQQTVTHDYTIQNNYNAGSFGPITINSGITVTVGAGESWTVI